MASSPTYLAAAPPMGWNSWNIGSAIHETSIRETADAPVASGLKDCGCQYTVIDDCWSVKSGGLSFLEHQAHMSLWCMACWTP